ncbi:unnamed protein product [Rotaria socialis]|uniref:CTP synthase n=1 Tax=Rotaria socialis TaxID=392032 RepID=A0A818QXN5_9BILA|nr:unnamed protein product [Rotaria socialis]
MKYILVTGGVISGIGKGIISSSIGTILRSYGFRVTSIKIDPYINIDAGTFSPYEHGEVFVLDDGGEVDLDLGNYERFLDITLHRDNNITAGKIYRSVIDKERRGDYLGKTVQVVPHITDAIQEWVERVACISVDDDKTTPDICIVELGGTIGDIESMPFVEAFRQFQFRVKRDNFCLVHVSLVPQPNATKEHKTKPTQHSVKELRGHGLSPDLIICRCETQMPLAAKEKVAMFCQVEKEHVICIPDVNTLYRVPVLLQETGVFNFLSTRLGLTLKCNYDQSMMIKWRELIERSERQLEEVVIALVGKYTALEDAYASVLKALNHAALFCNRKLNIRFVHASDLEANRKKEDPVKYHEAWQQLCSAHGVIVPGGFGSRGVEGKIAAIEWARTQSKPFLGICLGLQCAVIEFARHVLQYKGANSSEFDKVEHQVVIEMPEHNTGTMGGTMRLGRRTTHFVTDDSILKKLYGNVDTIDERHRHRYEVNPKYVEEFEKAGMKFVGHSDDNQRMEILELDNHPYFVAVQYHPEYISRPLKPTAPYLGLIWAACGELKNVLTHVTKAPTTPDIAELALCSIATPLSYYTIFFKIKNEKPVEEEGEQRPGKIGVLSFCQSGDITGQESLFFLWLLSCTKKLFYWIVKYIDFATNENLKKHTDLQNEVNDRICKQQVSAKISTHGLSFISGNLVYDARQPEEKGLVPLGEGPKIVSAREFYNDLCEKAERERRSNRKNKSSNYHKDIGDDIQMSEFALQKNVPLGPADLNLLATVGPRTIHVYDKLCVVVLSNK